MREEEISLLYFFNSLLVFFTKAEADAYTSKHPFLPHEHLIPFLCITICPNSPAIPLIPVIILLFNKTAPPIPVPKVIITTFLCFFIEPNFLSATNAAFASFITLILFPVNFLDKKLIIFNPVKGILGVKQITPVFSSTPPGTAIPIEEISLISILDSLHTFLHKFTIVFKIYFLPFSE